MGTIRQLKAACLEHALQGLGRLARFRERTDRLPPHLQVGIEGENAVFFFLLSKGYTVVARRWSSGELPGDVDLIAWDGPILCFIEVKTRTAHDATPAEVAVDGRKRTVLRRLARRYVHQLPQQASPPVRFDVVSVYLVPGKEKEFQHFEGAFAWNDDPRG